MFNVQLQEPLKNRPRFTAETHEPFVEGSVSLDDRRDQHYACIQVITTVEGETCRACCDRLQFVLGALNRHETLLAAVQRAFILAETGRPITQGFLNQMFDALTQDERNDVQARRAALAESEAA